MLFRKSKTWCIIIPEPEIDIRLNNPRMRDRLKVSREEAEELLIELTAVLKKREALEVQEPQK